MIIYLVIMLIGVLIFHIYIRYSDSGKLIDQIPGPTPLPLLGNMLSFNLSSDKLWLKILEALDEYYPIVRVWFFTCAAVFIRHPDDLKILLSCKKNINKGKSGYDNLRFIGNDGLIVSGGEKWRVRRKMLAPAHNPKLLSAYIQLAQEHLQKFIINLKSQGKETTIDLLETFTNLNLHIIVETAMGVDMGTFSVESEQAGKAAFHEICEITFYRVSRPYIRDWMMRFLSVGRRQAKAVKVMRDLISKIVIERRNYHKQHEYEMLRGLNSDDLNGAGSETTTGSSKLRLAVLDLLLAAQLDGLIDEKGVYEEVETVLAAGHETTSVAMAFLVLLLAENEDAQERVRNEVLEAIIRNDGKIISSEIQKLDYLDRCIKESLRLFPPAPIIARFMTNNLHLKNYTLPAGHEAIINFYPIHRDSNFWPEPNKFDPDRFLPENSIGRHAFAYLPFSAGPRSCSGQKFALIELKIMLAHLLSNFRLEAVEQTADIKFEMNITLKPTKPIRVKLIRID